MTWVLHAPAPNVPESLQGSMFVVGSTEAQYCDVIIASDF